jgi:hypothetical protein
MLFKIKPLGQEFQTRFLAVTEWPEIYFSDEVKLLLESLPDVLKVYRSTVKLKIERQPKKHTHLPCQYVLYAVKIKEFALALYEYIKVLDGLKNEGLSSAVINQLIVSRNSESSNLIKTLSTQEQANFFDLFGQDKNFALGAKTFLSGESELRGEKEFFASVILKVINVPDQSNTALGHFIFSLCENNSSVYSKLENIFLKDLDFSIQVKGVNEFAHAVFRFLWSYDKFEKLRVAIQPNKNESNLTIETEAGRLPSVFKGSDKYLDKEDLISGVKPRFFEEPICFYEQKFIYLSTEWTHDRDKRLDLVMLKQVVEHCYPQFAIDLSEEYFTLSAKGSQKVARKKLAGIFQPLPKPFLLLAGISGTGKSRFVKQQALSQCSDLSNFLPVAVRPDWHEPSDLLGYVSRIQGESYVYTPFLKFIVRAWIDAIESVEGSEITLKPLENIVTYWACLDEMNLAPVEQYFADYLSVLETREWVGAKYKCGSLLNPKDLLHSSAALELLRKELGLDSHETVWEYFLQNGISIPPNLIVAGTVNMDETTHGFSRKVIDRAFTIDFGDFFPNKFISYFIQDANFKSLTFARYSSVTEADLRNVKADPTGELSIKFLSEINKTLITTPFEIAYRALNELLVALVCFLPKDNKELVAVWDDFLMTKVLPRIEGDAEKLHFRDGISLLTDLSEKIHTCFLISADQNLRPDLLRTSISGDVLDVEFRSRKKIAWMEQRLIEHSFTSFWP